MNNWINIKDKKPEQDQEVWYYFHGNVYSGLYSYEDDSETYHRPEGTYCVDVFYGKSGFLTNDVEYWQPRHNGDKKPVFEKIYDESKYFVDGTEG